MFERRFCFLMDEIPINTSPRARLTPVVDTLPADLLTPLGVYLKLSAGAENSFLLESVEGGENLARYSFIGADPEFLVEGNDKQIVITGQRPTEERDEGMFAYLRNHFSEFQVEAQPDLPAFIGGAIGYLSFECADWFEPSLKKPDSVEAGHAAFMFYRTIVAFDHVKQLIRVVTIVFDHEGDDAIESIDAARKRNLTVRRQLEEGTVSVPRPDTKRSVGLPISNWERDTFEGAVDKIKEMIRAGDCYQVVLSQRFSKETNASPIGVYRALRSLNPSPYMFLLQFGEKGIIGASPEMLVKCEGEKLEYRPIAGTRPRGGSASEDNILAEEMRLDKKEVAEHLMLVDLGRNDLGRVAEYGSVNVETLMSVEKYSHVQHLVSSLSANIRDGFDRFDALAACFPAGTVSGAPKVRAMEIIGDLEPDIRGLYAGTVGYFDYSGNLDTCIAIRTLVLEDGIAHIQAGAGIVADSVASNEFDETVNKARVLLRALEIAESDLI